MYAFISGVIETAANGAVVIDNNGIGYKVHVSGSTLSKLPAPGKSVKLYTYLHIREDAMELFGFLSMEEKEIYELLISVSGVGPKAGLAILSVLDPDGLIRAVINGDQKSISKAPGVGPKLAQRVILELKDKFKGYKAEEMPAENFAAGNNVSEAAEALTALGYTLNEATRAVAGLEGTVEQIISQGLKNLMRNK